MITLVPGGVSWFVPGLQVSCWNKTAHLQTWYSPNPADTTQHQTDHTIIRRRDSKCILDTRVYRGVDVDSDQRLTVSKLRLKFRKPSKPTQHRRLHPGPLLTEEGQAAMHHLLSLCMLKSPPMMSTIVGSCFAHLSPLLVKPLVRQPPKAHKPWISEATMQLADHRHPVIEKLGRPATLQKPRPCTSQPWSTILDQTSLRA